MTPSGGNSRAATYSALFDKYSKNYSVNPGVSLKLLDNTATLDASAFYSYANIKYPNYNTVTATTSAAAPGGLGWSLDFRNRDPQFPIFSQTSGPSVYDAASYTPGGNSKIVWWTASTYQNAKVDLLKNLGTAVPASIKVGVKYSKNEQVPQRNQEASTWTGTGSIVPYVETSYRQANGHYGPFPFIRAPGMGGSSKDILSSGKYIITDADAYGNFVNSTTGDGRFEEKLTSAYLQSRIKWGRLGLLAGLRAEKTENIATGFIPNNSTALSFNAALTREQNLDRAGARFAAGKSTINAHYQNVFPGLHLTYEAVPSLLFRLSYNKSISRPNIPSTVQFGGSVNPDSNTISIGNPGLKPYTSDNYEFSTEKYFEPVGKITAGAFYKDIKNYFTNFIDTVPTGSDNGFDGAFAGYTRSTPRNTGKAKIKGFNIDYSQQFSFLPGFWKGFGITANFTRLKAEGNFSPNAAGTAYSSTLPGLVPKSANAGLSYIGHGLQLRVLAGYRGEFILAIPAAVGTAVPNAGNTQYRDARTLWDFKSSYSINERYEVYLDVYNLTNEPTSTQRVANRQTFTLWQGTSFSAGVNVRF